MSDKAGSSFLKSMMKFSIASWLRATIAFISVPIVTRAFPPEEFGKISMFTLSVTFISLFVGLSLDQSYIRFFKENDSGNYRKSMLTQFIGVCFITYTIFILFNILFGKSLSIYLFGEFNPFVVYIALPLMVIMTVILSYQSIYFRMSENAFGYGVLNILTAFATYICMVFAALFNPSYTYGILFMVLGLSFLVIGCKTFVKKSFDINLPIIKKKQIIPFLKYSLPLMPVAIISFFNMAIIRFLIKDYSSYSTLGIFTVSLTITALLSLIQSGFTTYWAPFMYSNYKTEIVLIKKIHSGISFLMISFALLIILFSDLIFIILGEEYRNGRNIFALLLITPVTYTISETTCYGTYINKKTQFQLYSIVFSFIITASLGFLLIPNYGILGAALTNAAGGITFFLTITYYGLKEYDSAEKLYRTLCAIGILIFASLINYWIPDIILRNILVILLLIIILGMYRDILKKLPTIFYSVVNKFHK